MWLARGAFPAADLPLSYTLPCNAIAFITKEKQIFHISPTIYVLMRLTEYKQYEIMSLQTGISYHGLGMDYIYRGGLMSPRRPAHNVLYIIHSNSQLNGAPDLVEIRTE